MNYKECISRLTPLHGQREAMAIVRTVMEVRFGFSLADLLLGKDSALSAEEHDDLKKIMQRLLLGEPVQYVLGHTHFRGIRLEVMPDVLIPRPETEQIVTFVPKGGTVADLGTGSGCIAIAVALERSPRQVIAADISKEALEVARRNAEANGANVEFILQDMLDVDATCARLPMLDALLSNPPYIRRSEEAEMPPTVTRHEPAQALFVPDESPLLFYEAIGRIAQQRLRPGGILAVEANEALAEETAKLFSDMKFRDTAVHQDCFGKPRFVTAVKAYETLHPLTHPVYVMAKPVGSACNLACRYCYYLDKHTAGGVMSDKVLEEFTRQYIEAQTQTDVLFTWHGGEPTMAGLPFFRRAMKLQRQYAGGHRISNSLQTNGTLLTDEWCRFLAQHRWLVGLSIDGPQPLHDEGRHTRGGAPSFDRVMRAAGLLNKYGVEWNAMATVNRVNVEHPTEFYRFFRDGLKCTFIQFTPVGEELDAKAWGRFLCAVYDEWVRSDVGRVFVQLFDATLANWVGEQPGVCSMAATCGHAAVIERSGDVFGCDHFVDEAHWLGNIMDGETITSLLYSERQQRFGLDKEYSLPAQCRRCRWLFACHGECPRLRTAVTADGEPGLNCLCEGYRQFFAHVAPTMEFMAAELRASRPPANIIRFLRGK